MSVIYPPNPRLQKAFSSIVSTLRDRIPRTRHPSVVTTHTDVRGSRLSGRDDKGVCWALRTALLLNVFYMVCSNAPSCCN